MSYAPLRAWPCLKGYGFRAMKPQPTAAPALTPQSLASVAGRKTRRVQKKLHDAEMDMRFADEVLEHGPHAKEIEEALERNANARRKVHEAAEELDVVKEILENTDAREPTRPSSPGKTGQGVRSLLPHLKPTR
jgi:hypothetical protein